MSWAMLFERAPDRITLDDIQTALSEHRAGRSGTDSETSTASEPPEPSPTRVVVDADVLAADICLDGPARAVLGDLYRQSWMTLVASDQLLADAEAVIETVATEALATEWRDQITAWRQPVDHPSEDHPALGSAYRGGAMHVLSFDEALTSSAAGATLNNYVSVSVRQPDAFQLLFDPASLYATEHDGQYPGPDRPSRC